MAPKMGAGFSRILSKLDKPEILELILQKQLTSGASIVD
jgi:hypothetical protein